MSGPAGPPPPPAGPPPPAAGRHPVRTRFVNSPFPAAIVIVLILSAAAGLFAGSYCFALANPTPHRIPIGVTGSSEHGGRLVTGLERALGSSLPPRRFPDDPAALAAVDRQEIFAVLRLLPGHAELQVASASGASVARVLRQAGPPVGRQVGVPVTVRDVRPLQSTDPQGLALFYVSLAAVLVGFVGAAQLSVHAKALHPVERVAVTATYAGLGGLSICLVVDPLLGVLDLPLTETWGILTLTMFASGMVFTMFQTLVGRWAILPTWGLMVLIGSPSSGGAVSWALLPEPFGTVGRWLPPGACVNAVHNAVYFPHHQQAAPLWVLGTWAALATAVFLVWRERHPGGRARRGRATAAPAPPP
ncbi:hypothetical protein AQ490_15855 [Wenjunlia vitaminophila]|uniref:ABC transporter permease n=1 Tax=Wenjunlia vitaminophila TaxID=76728 RepID=A0A0T6LXS9_WENVI|nr:hypothetical protein [Wenjunlia vitaminophila]KRV50543.1 hypothetical protein AQ490_15855 [Wenjunlia vitaminophila]